MGVLLKEEDLTTREILDQLIGKFPTARKYDLRAEISRFMNAAVESGQLLLRHRSVNRFPKTESLNLYKLELRL